MDNDLRSFSIVPTLDTEPEFRRVMFGTYTGAGRHLDFGQRLPLLFEQAGVGTPDGTDVAGRLEPLRTSAPEHPEHTVLWPPLMGAWKQRTR